MMDEERAGTAGVSNRRPQGAASGEVATGGGARDEIGGPGCGAPADGGPADIAPAPEDAVIGVRGVRVELGAREILRGVDLAVAKGELIGLIGPNGSGKSTLLKCIYRVLAPSGGVVFLDGRPLGAYSVRQSAQRLAVMAQHTAYNFEFSVRDIVLMGRAPHKRALERDTAADFAVVDEALRTVGLTELADRAFSTLSGGEQQRVVLARALAQQAPCLILDEPTNHLDVRYQLELMDIVRRLDKTVLCAVHDLNIAAMYCDRLYALREGRIVASGTPEQVITPEVIHALYDVDARVVEDEDGLRHVLYRPGGYGERP